VKFKEVKIGWSESSNEGYGSKNDSFFDDDDDDDV
jgi:hypothetical protein